MLPQAFLGLPQKEFSPMAYSTVDIRNLALVGQAGAGKTLLTESLLAESGAIRARGSLERGTTVCDFDPQEKAIQHSLDAAIVHFETGGSRVNLIDTPGYPDFAGRALSVLEAVETAAVVVSAVNGVEPVTQRMMEFAKERGLATLIIINKIDSRDAHPDRVLADLRETFGRECLPLNLPADGGRSVVDCFFRPGAATPDFSSVAAAHTEIIDQVVEVDEKLMALYLEQGEELTPEQLHDPFEKALREGHLTPVCFVSAETGAGVKELLEIFSAADAESARRQSAAVSEGRRRRRRARQGGPRSGQARDRARVQSDDRSVRRAARRLSCASGRGSHRLAALRRRCAQAVQGRAPVRAAGQGPRGDSARDSGGHLRRGQGR
jgi:small GTP-binding protein